jgi:hypothetical protein
MRGREHDHTTLMLRAIVAPESTFTHSMNGSGSAARVNEPDINGVLVGTWHADPTDRDPHWPV